MTRLIAAYRDHNAWGRKGQLDTVGRMLPEQGEVDSVGIRSHQLSPWDGGGCGNNSLGWLGDLQGPSLLQVGALRKQWSGLRLRVHTPGLGKAQTEEGSLQRPTLPCVSCMGALTCGVCSPGVGANGSHSGARKYDRHQREELATLTQRGG